MGGQRLTHQTLGGGKGGGLLPVGVGQGAQIAAQEQSGLQVIDGFQAGLGQQAVPGVRHQRLALDILSWQRLRNRLPARLPLGTKVAHKTGTTARNYHDAGIIYLGDQPLFILSAYTDEVPLDLPDGTPGHTAAHYLIAQMSRDVERARDVLSR